MGALARAGVDTLVLERDTVAGGASGRNGGFLLAGVAPFYSEARELYGEAVIYERHRHRYEVNNHFRPRLVEAGLVVSGTYQEGRLVEVIELPDHPWFVASQFHPEFKSRPTRPAPLFREFVGAALTRARSRGRVAVAG